ncbi:hypothetical protein PAERUG_P64_East_of_England_6_01_14_02971 [Pseudomonas aeruginosa]|nr:hypothetical protein PAERUG_P64_East_of_England_6_01_14_02971 [Pseudomonas aeruginosa]
MLMPEEVLLLQLIADNVPCRVVQHQAAEYPLLRLDGVRRRKFQNTHFESSRLICRNVLPLPSGEPMISSAFTSTLADSMITEPT